MSEMNTGKTVDFTIDLDGPPPFTPEELEQLERLKAMRDEDIDFSDIPPQAGKEGWTRPGKYGGPVGELRLARVREDLLAMDKVLVLDGDVLEFFKETGDVSPDRINAALREYAEMHRKSA